MCFITRKTSFHRPFRRRGRPGFTLVEAALTTMIVGLGTVAMMGLLSGGVGSTLTAANLTTAVNLATGVHELCDRLPFPASGGSWGLGANALTNLLTSGNVTWLDGRTFSPPIDSTNTANNTMSDWSQAISVSSVDPNNVTSTITNSTVNSMARVTVTINYNGHQVFQTSWLAVR